MTPRPDVVHVSSAHPANDPRIFEKECAALAASGRRVHLVATGPVPTPTGVTVTSLPRSDRRLVRMSLGALRASIYALRTRAAIVHLHDPELAPWIPLFRLARRKVVFDSHEDLSGSVSTKEYLSPPLRLALSAASRLLVRFVDRSSSAVVAATPAIARLFRNPRTVVVQNFPKLASFPDKKASPSASHLLYLGGLNAARGARQMIDAVGLVVQDHPDVSLTIAGKIAPDLLAELETRAGWSSVDFVGHVSRDEVNALIGQADIGLVLFQPEPNHVESQPTKMFEYMIGGLAVVTSDFPLWRGLVEDAGVGVVADPTDATAVARAIGDLVGDPQVVRTMGRRAQELVAREHNWEVEATRLVGLYAELDAL